jgi:hypothetical protein
MKESARRRKGRPAGGGGGHRHRTLSLLYSNISGYTGARPQLTAINQAIKQAIKQESVFNTEEKGRTTECTERQGFWRFAQAFSQPSREAQPLAYSVDSVVLPSSSVLKTLA